MYTENKKKTMDGYEFSLLLCINVLTENQHYNTYLMYINKDL